MKKVFRFVMYSFLLVLLIECKKPVSDNVEEIKKLFNVSDTDPYDSIGLMHNSCMDYYLSHANFTNYITASNGAFHIVENYMHSKIKTPLVCI